MPRTTRLELEIGGKVRPMLFDFTFLDFMSDIIPYEELDALAGTKPWRLLPILALASLRSGADFESSKETFDTKTVTDWVQQMEPLEANKLVECYKSAMGFIGVALSGKSAELGPDPSTGKDLKSKATKSA